MRPLFSALAALFLLASATLAAGPTVDPQTPADAHPRIASASDAAGWTLTFSDEFESPVLDPHCWLLETIDRGELKPKTRPSYRWAHRPENVRLDGRGHLEIAFMRDDPAKPEFSSGLASTKGRFAQRYGFFEARLRLPRIEGKQAAFWLMPAGGITPGRVFDGTADDGAEIDILESNQNDDRFHTSVHWDGYAEHHRTSPQKVPAPGLQDGGFHTFGLEWTAAYLKFYYEGQLVRTIDDPAQIPDVPSYPILSGGILAACDGDIFQAALPDTCAFDYLRVWSR